MIDLVDYEHKLRRGRRLRLVLLFAIIAAPVLYLAVDAARDLRAQNEREAAREQAVALTDDELAGTRDLLGRLSRTIQGEQRLWEQHVTPAALARAVPVRGSSCPHTWTAPSDRNYYLEQALRRSDLSAPIPPDGLQAQAAVVDEVARALESGDADQWSLKRLRAVERAREQLVVVAKVEPAGAVNGRLYPPRIRGAVYLVDTRDGSVLCTARIDTVTSIRVEPGLAKPSTSLLHDLDAQLQRAIENGLERVEPR